ncbi:DNA-binding response regulator [Ktedonobacter sp. SOSP1-52]|uniref:response regulator transcription factor n=1 Tax=Ktedonobacter sp. SOSP1-52 TaxID=2778366 RepID=UPI001914FB3F|nr:response regulator transcription factor [Ktedonobacter sp. SOSP1-52]GHO64093.1 DNA-binding response regulator [Ktedonobacter sp. SOSP1-52]
MEVLVIEDEAPIREFEVTYLRDAGYGTIEAADGQTAVELFVEHKPDLAIIDINLPKMSGLDVCKAIRTTSTMPILIVTARDSDEDEVKGLSMGADDYIRKPFNPNVLVARVQALLRRHDRTRRRHFKGLVIDPETMSVMKDGKSITLTTTRFNLLLALASHPRAVLSRAQLVNQIYSDPSSHFVYDRTIDAHIKALRQSIETDPKNPQFIETVFGSGYRFIGEPEK